MEVLKLLKKKFKHRVFMFAALFLVCIGSSFAQNINISGVVSDESGQPLIGANLLVKGTTTGAQTDFDGNYSLSAGSDATLVVSYIGFVTQEVAVNGKNQINITLQEDASQLDEVVIVGYGTAKKSDLTGSVGIVNSKQIEKFTFTDASQALQGQVAGVSVQSTGGSPGAGANIVIRGAASFRSTNPLFVIDGMLTGSMSSVAPQDIESISVLKDASALAIYGSRAANGVVIITTKRGKSGKINITLDTSYGFQNLINEIDWADASQFAQITNRANDNDGQARFPANDTQFDPNYSSNLYDETFRTAGISNTNIRVTGGGENINYGLSFTQFEQEGIVKHSDFKRQTLRSSVNINKEKFKLESTIGLTRGVNNPNPYFNRERNLLPTIRLRNDAGDWSASDLEDRGINAQPGAFYGQNPLINELALAALEDRTNTTNTLLGNVAGSYEIIDGLTYKINLGVEHRVNNNYRFRPKEQVIIDSGNENEATLSETNTTFTSTLVDHTLSYKKTFGKHTLDAVVGFSEQKTDSRSLGANVRTFPSNDVRVVSAAEEIASTPSNQVNTAIHSYLGRINYNFNDRYLLTFSARQDKSSLFKADLQDANFFSGALAWNISNEPFMKNFDALTNIKLRLGYGETGSNNVAAYEGDPVLNFFSEYILGDTPSRVTGYAITRTVNPNITWETSNTSNIGLDFTALSNKLSVSMDYFIKETEDILIASPNVFYSGTGNNFPDNIATMENKGFEFLASYRDQIGDVNFSASFNFAKIDNEVTSMGNSSPLINGSFTSNTINSKKTDVGQPIGSFFGYVVDGIYQTDAEATAANDGPGNPRAGDLRFKDIDGDGDIDEDDQTYLGSGIPNFEYGFNLTAEYKNFDISLFFNGVSGNDILNGTKYRGYFDFNGNKFADALNAWSPTNTNATIPRNTRADPGFNRRMSDFYLENGAYFRLRNAQIGYALPDSILDKIKLDKVRIYLSAINLFTITDYTGYYPEVGRNGRGAGGNSVLNTGVDEGTTPEPRTFQLGIQVSF